MKKRITAMLILGLASLTGWQLYYRIMSGTRAVHRQKGTAVVPVEVLPVQKTTIRDIQTFTGTLVPKAHFEVAPKIGGRLEKLLVDIGDTIKRDQLIALLDDDEYAQSREQAQAELTVARANLEEQRCTLEVNQREYERIKTLHEKRVASDSEFDSSLARYKTQMAKYQVAMAQVSQKEAALKADEVRLSYTRIRAWWQDGAGLRVVGERFVDEGAMLSAHDPIVSIYDINSLLAVIFVIEADYPKLRIGQKALVAIDAFSEKSFTGQVARIAPVLKSATRQARVEIEISNPDWLIKPGMFARIRLEYDKHDEAMVVPVAALAKRNGRQGIFLADTEDMKARFVPVDLGLVQETLAEIVNPNLRGLVITLGQHLLEDGSAISFQNSPHESTEDGSAIPFQNSQAESPKPSSEVHLPEKSLKPGEKE
ncbi:MAG: efflux RND transporter periplasmic adaptor subunit [bacterium]